MSRGRETVEERRARLMPGAQWIVRERMRRDWSGRELARRLGVAQDRVSAYERAQDEPPAEFARSLALVFEVDEVTVWRALGKPLPAELRTEEAVEAYYMRKHPDVFAAVEEMLAGREGGNPVPKPRHSGVKRPDITQSGDPAPVESQRRVSGV